MVHLVREGWVMEAVLEVSAGERDRDLGAGGGLTGDDHAAGVGVGAGAPLLALLSTTGRRPGVMVDAAMI
jgi:hypothetical protein